MWWILQNASLKSGVSQSLVGVRSHVLDVWARWSSPTRLRAGGSGPGMGSPELPQDVAERLEKAALQPGRRRDGQEGGAASREVLDTSSSLKGDLATDEGGKMLFYHSIKPQQLWTVSSPTAPEASGASLHHLRLNMVWILCRTETAHGSKLKLPVLPQTYSLEELSCVKLCREPLNLCKKSCRNTVKILHDNFKCSNIYMS